MTVALSIPARRERPCRVIVVGGGVAGMGAALGLVSQGFSVLLLESGTTLGGACRSVEIDAPGHAPIGIDAGVSDFNRATFRQLLAMLDDMSLPLQPVCQEASFRTLDGQWLWSSSPQGCTLGPGIASAFTSEMARFRAEAPSAEDPCQPIGDWMRAHGFSQDIWRLWVAPRVLGCFPTPSGDPAAVPIRALARFWGMHGLVGPGPADRVCVQGGMHRYVPRLTARLRALGVTLRLGEAVQRIERWPLRVHTARETLTADAVVLAVEPALALRLLAAPSAEERTTLSACRTQPGRVVVHRDPRLMPSDRARWAAYNYVVPSDRPLSGPTITFYPERLACLPGPMPPVFVTLNPLFEPRGIIAEHVLAHPMFGRDDALAQALALLQGRHQTWFCGAWTAEPFLHEQGWVSGQAVADHVVAQMAAMPEAFDTRGVNSAPVSV